METDTVGEATRPATKASGGATQQPAAPATVQVNIRLRAVEGSDRPALANFSVVQGMPGAVFVDFGFLEPQALNAITRAGRTGTRLAEPVVGQLASRVAMDLQTARQLARQLNDLLRRAAGDAAPAAPADAAAAPLQ